MLLARQAAALAARSLPATAWAPQDLPRRDLPAPERPVACREPPADFAQAEETAPEMLSQALVNRQRR